MGQETRADLAFERGGGEGGHSILKVSMYSRASLILTLQY